MPTEPVRRPGSVYVARYDVDRELARLQLTFNLLAEAAWRGDVDRRNVPPFCYDGQPEYDAGSAIRSAICEHGGETDGGWHAGLLAKIPVAFNHSEFVAIHATAGIEGTGHLDGDPTNRSLKGPNTKQVSDESALTLGLEDTDNLPVDFWWYLTRRDEDGLWAELFAPYFAGDGGYATGYTTRIILGNLEERPTPVLRRVPDIPEGPDFAVHRKTG